MTQVEEKKEIQSLQRKCLYLWKAKVKDNAGNQCEAWEAGKRCKATKFLNAHHIENYMTNKDLRYDPKNGLCLCAGHHKFKRKSAHKSFVFLYLHMTIIRLNDLTYLINESNISSPQTKESLLRIIERLQDKPTMIKRIR